MLRKQSNSYRASRSGEKKIIKTGARQKVLRRDTYYIMLATRGVGRTTAKPTFPRRTNRNLSTSLHTYSGRVRDTLGRMFHRINNDLDPAVMLQMFMSPAATSTARSILPVSQTVRGYTVATACSDTIGEFLGVGVHCVCCRYMWCEKQQTTLVVIQINVERFAHTTVLLHPLQSQDNLQQSIHVRV